MKPKNEIIAQVGDPFGYVKDGKIFLKGFLHFADREIGEVKESETETVQYFTNRFELFVKKSEELFQAVEAAENKGSFLQKLLHLKDLCGSFDGLGDFAAIYLKLDEIEKFLQDLIAKNRIKNLTQKKAIVEELDQLKESNDWLNASEKIKELKNNWIRVGAVEKISEEEIENAFKLAIETFFIRRQEFYDARNELNVHKVKKYEELAQRADTLKNNINFGTVFDDLKSMTKEWKAVGLVPKRDLEPIMTRYRAATDYIFSKAKEYKRNKPVTFVPQGNIIEKFKAIEEHAEKILNELPRGGDEEIKKLQEEWKKVGFTKAPEYREIEIKFKSNCSKALDTYFLRRICIKRHPDMFKMTAKEQVRVQIGILKELIARDTEQIENFENNFSKQEVNSNDNSFDKVFGIKLMMQKRGLITKQLILKDLEEKLG